jgi:hypothetical protein
MTGPDGVTWWRILRVFADSRSLLPPGEGLR